MDLGIQQLIAALSKPGAADKLMAQNPNVDPAPLFSALQMEAAAASDAGMLPPPNQPKANAFASFDALKGAQIGAQQQKPQMVPPGAPRVGAAQPSHVIGGLPEPTTDFSFGQIMGGRRRV